MNRPIADLRARSLIAAFKARMTELARHVCVPGFVPMACGNANAGVWHYMGILRAKSTSYDFHGHLYNSIWIIIFPLRREGRMLASPVCRCAILLRQFRTVDRGGQPAPGLPCALFQLRVNDEAKLGRASREDAKVCLRS